MSDISNPATTQELPSGAAADAGGGRDIPSDAAAAGTMLSPIDAANLLAGQAVAAMESYLYVNEDGERLAQEASRLEAQSLGFVDPSTNGLLQGVRMLVVAMKGVAAARRQAAADGAAIILAEKWEYVGEKLVQLIRHQSRMLIEARVAEQATDAARAELYGDEPRG